jgi:hypothetical protein
MMLRAFSPAAFARAVSARARGRLDHELIGGEHEFGSQALRIRIAGGDEQARRRSSSVCHASLGDRASTTPGALSRR